MKSKLIRAGIAATGIGLLSLTQSVWACSAAGPDVHIGPVSAVDVENGQFSIKDFESGQQITFKASAELLSDLAGRSKPVAVKYHKQNKDLVALEIQ